MRECIKTCAIPASGAACYYLFVSRSFSEILLLNRMGPSSLFLEMNSLRGEFAKTKAHAGNIKLRRSGCWRNGIWAAIPLCFSPKHVEWQKTTFVFSADVLNCMFTMPKSVLLSCDTICISLFCCGIFILYGAKDLVFQRLATN